MSWLRAAQWLYGKEQGQKPKELDKYADVGELLTDDVVKTRGDRDQV